MIDVYVRDIDEAKGHWLGAFRPEQLKDLPELFDMFVTANADGEDCQLVDTRFVMENRTFFEIVVEATGKQAA